MRLVSGCSTAKICGGQRYAKLGLQLDKLRSRSADSSHALQLDQPAAQKWQKQQK